MVEGFSDIPGSVSRYLAAFGPSRAPSGAWPLHEACTSAGVLLVTDTAYFIIGFEE